jgi:hypothetical protein
VSAADFEENGFQPVSLKKISLRQPMYVKVYLQGQWHNLEKNRCRASSFWELTSTRGSLHHLEIAEINFRLLLCQLAAASSNSLQ